MFVILLIKKNYSVEHTGGHAEVADLFEYNGGSPQVKKAFWSENLIDEDMWCILQFTCPSICDAADPV